MLSVPVSFSKAGTRRARNPPIAGGRGGISTHGSVFYGLFYGRAKFWCKTAQFYATPCEYELGETPSIRNGVQSYENLRNSLGLNYESPALPLSYGPVFRGKLS